MNSINSIAALNTATNPYPDYCALLSGPELVFNEQLQCWVASRAAVVDEVFNNPYCLVRPSAEQVPKTLVGSSAGDIFARLIRMNEGNAHACPKLATLKALNTLDGLRISICTNEMIALLAAKYALSDGAYLAAWMFDLPIYVVAKLLGFNDVELPRVAEWARDFVCGISPLGNAEQLNSASVAARALLLRFRVLIECAPVQEKSLLSHLLQEAQLAGWDNCDAILANLIGFLSQTYEATAGLIGNGFIALFNRPELQLLISRDISQMDHLVQEVCRFDPPVQNTRRFVAQATIVANQHLQAGDSILVLLAAASRDEQVNARPDEFILERTNRRLFVFGHGRHACPGQNLSCTIASAALSGLLPLLVDIKQLNWTYRPSFNVRVPEFTVITKRS
ncbi:cytochrome P450 [Solimicrobium silvestre]|uniref:Cytochrome P450 n=1 Tax=Solimicrobium silvestre TaxID=2099400 RepID=A0A2S9H5L6_9BURK|nr:cytochrome P450 [Solimicrobium silvestre]PRC95267.1 Cytochrome P450 [Solimicrobium silvestre]